MVDKTTKGLCVRVRRAPEGKGERMGLADSASPAPVDLHEGVPGTGLRSRELKVFGAVEVAHHWLLPGEIETQPFRDTWSTCT